MANILIVDADEPRSRQVRDSLETHADWRVLCAADGAEGRRLFEANAVDLVIIELTSTGLPAADLFEWIRNDRGHVPVVLLTAADADERTKVQALVMGAASYVPHSYVARDLRVTVERILGLTGCRRRHARLMETLQSTQTVFRIDHNELKLIPVVIGQLIDTAEEFGIVTGRSRVQTAVALEEAITNGIVHGNLEVPSQLKDDDFEGFYRMIDRRRGEEAYAGRRLFVRGEFKPGVCSLTITDEGAGFDPTRVVDPTTVENIDKPHGRGLFLIRSFMDDVRFNDVGNEIQLTKRAPDS